MPDIMTNPDPAQFVSPVPFRATVDRLVNAIENAGMTLFAQIDHAAGARDVGMDMPPTVVLIYGNAKGGTPIMLAAPLVALDLPLRVLVHENRDGHAVVSFHPMAPLLRQAGVPDALTTRLEPAQRLLVEAIRS
jgi:uncharacterized protein (DUF302 family)